MGLGREALDAGVDQALAELIEVENADDKDGKTEKIEKGDAAGQPARTEPAKEKPAASGRRARFSALIALGAGRLFRLADLVQHGSAPSRAYCSLNL